MYSTLSLLVLLNIFDVLQLSRTLIISSYHSFFRDLANVAHSYLSESVNPPAVILIGHSLGGAVCVHAANKGLIPSLAGLVVIDVVEGNYLKPPIFM